MMLTSQYHQYYYIDIMNGQTTCTHKVMYYECCNLFFSDVLIFTTNDTEIFLVVSHSDQE